MYVSHSTVILDNSSILLSFFKAVVEDVERHREALNKLGAAVKVVAELVDESDQQLLNCQLDEVTGQYKILKFNSRGYPVERWLEDRETRLCSLAPTGVLVSPVQVSTAVFLSSTHFSIQTDEKSSRYYM